MLHREWISYDDQLQDQRWKTKRQEILQRDNHMCQMCSSKGSLDNPLEVHHRYYLYPSYAWQYNSDALITLCARCHTLIHLTISPLSYAYNQKRELVIMNFTPCIRCLGAGYFREYKHVENGICFRCRGERFEELIDKKEIIIIDNFINHNDKIFDNSQKQLPSIEIIEKEEKTKDNFKIGVGYLEGKYGYPKDEFKAKSYLYEAAINGHKEAQYELANIILLDKETIKNIKNRKDALRWFVYAAMKGHRLAPKFIAAMLRTGIVDNQSDFYADEWERINCINEDDEPICINTGIAVAIAYNKPQLIHTYKRRLDDLAAKGNKMAIALLESSKDIYNKYC